MMVLFVSQCEKRALKRTRRVLDTFAERIGDNTWRTAITAEGLKAVRKLLRKNASKSTAVSCHWIRSRNHSELLWIVGNRDKFDLQGIVPVHRTHKSILDLYREHDWHYLPVIQAVAAMAALFHDWGKANDVFQSKLSAKKPIADPLRHEWISAMLLGAFIAIDPDSWLMRLEQGRLNETEILQKMQHISFDAFSSFPTTAQMVLWLILSHHKLPTYPATVQTLSEEFSGELFEEFEEFFAYVNEEWGYCNGDISHIIPIFRSGLLSDSQAWIKQIKRWAKKLNILEDQIKSATKERMCRMILHHARVGLMLGDYGYSSADADPRWQSSSTLYANTDKQGNYKQKLDEHLCGVRAQALRVIQYFPYLHNSLPRAHKVRNLLRPSPKGYQWQDKAVNAIRQTYTHLQKKEGFFAVNMASTGAGKTIANAKIMQALNPDHSLRYILALGLRTLTLQTGDAYREMIGLDDEQLAVMIGSKAMQQLHGSDEETLADMQQSKTGSESSRPLTEVFVDYEGAIDDQALQSILRTTREQQILYAPVLTATIDHIMGAVDTPKGGGHLLASLRLMGSDLVIDEIDDFTGSDLIAIARLVHLAGMLGSRVMISSATISPDFSEGFLHAYASGWQLYAQSTEAIGAVHAVWIDEFGTSMHRITKVDNIASTFRTAHHSFVEKRLKNLRKLPIRRKALIADLPEDTSHSPEAFFQTIAAMSKKLHTEHHTVDPHSGKRISFGVVRMANISPCVSLASYLCNMPEDEMEMKIMVYHSNQILLLRHDQERHLDRVLRRKETSDNPPAAFDDPVIRKHIDSSSHKDLMFIVVATPVEEVGRDHDFDWAVIEPSSFRSIIQMAGRVMRHREGIIDFPNIAIMQYNYKAYTDGDQKEKSYFVHPGFEGEYDLILNSHNLKELIDVDAILERLDAAWRIRKPSTLSPRTRLADLEHEVIARSLCAYDQKGPQSLEGWIDGYWYLTALPLQMHRFRAGEPTVKCTRFYHEEEDRYSFVEFDRDGNPIEREEILGIHPADVSCSRSSRMWLERDYNRTVEHYADQYNISKEEVTRRFGELSFTRYRGQESFEYSDQFGLIKKEEI